MIALPVVIWWSMVCQRDGGGTSAAVPGRRGGWRRRRRSPRARRRRAPRSRRRRRARASTPVGRRRLLGVAHAAAPSAGCSPAIMRPSTSRGVSPGTMPTMRPRYMTMMRSARATTSSSSVETTTTGTPASRVCDDALVDELDRADVDAAGRLGGDEQAQVAAELAGEHDLLLVAAGEPADLGVDALRADVELLDLVAGEVGEGAALDVAASHERRAVAAVEHEVLGDRELADQAVLGAVLGHEADAGVEDAPHARGS